MKQCHIFLIITLIFSTITILPCERKIVPSLRFDKITEDKGSAKEYHPRPEAKSAKLTTEYKACARKYASTSDTVCYAQAVKKNNTPQEHKPNTSIVEIIDEESIVIDFTPGSSPCLSFLDQYVPMEYNPDDDDLPSFRSISPGPKESK